VNASCIRHIQGQRFKGFGDPNEIPGFGFSITPLLSPSRRPYEPEAITPVNDRFKFKVYKPPLGANQGHVLWAWIFTGSAK
jgi:hypothetical protein